MYTLTTKEKLFSPSDIGLYRDDGLGVIRGTPRNADKLKKSMEAVFKKLGFKIEVEHSI